MPLSRTPAQTFDAAVLDAVEHLEAHGLTELDAVEFAVEDVPDVPPGGVDGALQPDVLEDSGVPLARLHRDGLGDVRRPVIVLYRRPLETRAADPDDLVDLAHEIIIDRLAHLLGRDPDDLDPHVED